MPGLDCVLASVGWAVLWAVAGQRFKRIDMSRRNLWFFWAQLPLVCAGVAIGTARAQIASKPDPSPFAPGDLKRPIFDTQKPSYEATNWQEKSASAVVAEVDGRPVTLGDVADAIKELPPSMKALPFGDLFPGILDKLVREQALVIRGYQQGLDEDPAVRRKLKAAADKVMANELLHHEISEAITEQALLDLYNKDFAGRPGAEQVHVRVIMSSSEAAAMGVIAKLQAGADFATLAKASSQDTTAPVGGDLGYVRVGGLNAEVGAVAFSLAAGQFTPFPVHSEGAYFVVKVEDRRQQPTPSFSAARERLVGTILREGVPDVVTRAMARVSVRKYSISGKEIPETAR